MAKMTVYVVQTFIETDGGLVAEEPFQVQTALEGIAPAEEDNRPSRVRGSRDGRAG
jgi:hypothetical protein